MDKPVEILNDLHGVYADGAKFYRNGATQTENTQLQNLFEQLANTREAAANQIEPFLNGRNELEPKEGTIAGKIRMGYVDLANAISSKETSEDRFISQLEEHEDRTLEQLNNALEEDLPPAVHEMLTQQKTAFTQTHDQMRELKRTVS